MMLKTSQYWEMSSKFEKDLSRRQNNWSKLEEECISLANFFGHWQFTMIEKCHQYHHYHDLLCSSQWLSLSPPISTILHYYHPHPSHHCGWWIVVQRSPVHHFHYFKLSNLFWIWSSGAPENIFAQNNGLIWWGANMYWLYIGWGWLKISNSHIPQTEISAIYIRW